MNQETFENYPQQPHGGKLVNQVLTGEERDKVLARAKELPMIMVDLEAVITLEMIAIGVMSPNDGFMVEEDYESVLKNGRLKNGVVWPVPLSFAPTGERNKEVVSSLSIGDEVILANESKDPVAILKVDDIFQYDKEKRASHLFGTTDRDHPGVDAIFRRMGDIALGGPIQLLNRVNWGPFEKLRLEPRDTWRIFYEEKKFRSTAGFITGANPLHRGHEYIHKNALEEIDGLLLQPLVEMAKREYTRHEFRMLSYRSVLNNYYPKDRSILAPLRVTYVFAGPRETVLHALIMKNFGCTHALIGRDHAGIGDYYDKYASHTIFDEFTPQELGIDVRLFYEVFYCTHCATHATSQTCPHDERYRLNISGTGIREMLRHGILPPKEVVRPESALAGIQGVQPKGVDENKDAILSVGSVVKSMFPYYLKYNRLGGTERTTPLDPQDLTIRDLELASDDARSSANKIYDDIYQEYWSLLDHNDTLRPVWKDKARERLYEQQKRIIDDLKEKYTMAPEQASDEFMYQDKAEVERELKVAERLLDDIPPRLNKEDLEARTWNTLPYKRYRGADQDD